MALRISISNYRPHDRPALLALLPELFEEYAGRLHRSALLVARHRGKAIGLLLVAWHDSPAYYDPAVSRFCEIQEVHVDPEFRNQGVATSLVERALRLARKRRCEAVYLETDAFNSPARRVYEKCGFRRHSSVIRYKRRL